MPFSAPPQLPVHEAPCGNPAQFVGQVAPITRVLFGESAQEALTTGMPAIANNSSFDDMPGGWSDSSLGLRAEPFCSMTDSSMSYFW